MDRQLYLVDDMPEARDIETHMLNHEPKHYYPNSSKVEIYLISEIYNAETNRFRVVYRANHSQDACKLDEIIFSFKLDENHLNAELMKQWKDHLRICDSDNLYNRGFLKNVWKTTYKQFNKFSEEGLLLYPYKEENPESKLISGFVEVRTNEFLRDIWREYYKDTLLNGNGDKDRIVVINNYLEKESVSLLPLSQTFVNDDNTIIVDYYAPISHSFLKNRIVTREEYILYESINSSL